LLRANGIRVLPTMATRRKSFDTEASRDLNANDVDYPPAVSARISGVVAAASAVEISRLAAIGPPRVSNWRLISSWKSQNAQRFQLHKPRLVSKFQWCFGAKAKGIAVEF
jgi:hypothetical protein